MNRRQDPAVAREEGSLNRGRSKVSYEKHRSTKFPMKKELGIIIKVPWEFRTEAQAIHQKLQLEIDSKSQGSQRKALSDNGFRSQAPEESLQIPESLGLRFQGKDKRKMTRQIPKDKGKHSSEPSQRVGSKKSYQRNFAQWGKLKGSKKRDQGSSSKLSRPKEGRA